LLHHAAEPSAVHEYVDAHNQVHEVAMRATSLTVVPAVCIFDLGSREEHRDVRLPLVWRGRQLQALVVHQGEDGRGHYIAAGRAKGGVWWVKSDTEVEAVDSVTDIHMAACLAVYCGKFKNSV
jgi:hypothetical protein